MRIKYEVIKKHNDCKTINYSYVCAFKNLKNAVNFIVKAKNYNINDYYVLRGRMVSL